MDNQAIMFEHSDKRYRIFTSEHTLTYHNIVADNVTSDSIMLATGLYDTNGTIIYERDVLKLPNADMGEVIFTQGAFYFRNFDNQGEPVLLSEVSSTSTIIACVYQDPTLTDLF